MLLVIQYLLGFLLNLYIPMADFFSAPFGQLPGQWILTAHIVNGSIVVIVAIILFAGAINRRDIAMELPLAVGLVAILFSLAGGITFLLGGANNVFSYLMATGWLIAFGSYVYAAGGITMKHGMSRS